MKYGLFQKGKKPGCAGMIFPLTGKIIPFLLYRRLCIRYQVGKYDSAIPKTGIPSLKSLSVVNLANKNVNKDLFILKKIRNFALHFRR